MEHAVSDVRCISLLTFDIGLKYLSNFRSVTRQDIFSTKLDTVFRRVVAGIDLF